MCDLQSISLLLESMTTRENDDDQSAINIVGRKKSHGPIPLCSQNNTAGFSICDKKK